MNCPLIIPFLVQGKRTLRRGPSDLIILDTFDLGVLGELGARMAGETFTLPMALHPTSSSWLNLGECWFAEMTNKAGRRGRLQRVPVLIEKIREFSTLQNAQAKAFAWTGDG